MERARPPGRPRVRATSCPPLPTIRASLRASPARTTSSRPPRCRPCTRGSGRSGWDARGSCRRSGRDDAADRWIEGDFGPTTPMARQSALDCATCGFMLPLGGPLGQAFAICANEISPADGRVVRWRSAAEPIPRSRPSRWRVRRSPLTRSAGIRSTSVTPSGARRRSGGREPTLLPALAPRQEDHPADATDDADDGCTDPPRGAIRLKSGTLKQQSDEHQKPHDCPGGYREDRILVCFVES